MNKADFWSKLINRILETLLARSALRTGLGIALGGALSFLGRLFEPALKNTSVVDFAGAPWWGWLCAGVVVMHAPTIVWLFKRCSVGNDDLDRVLELVERGNFSEAERRQQYRKIIERAISNVELPQGIQRDRQMADG